MTSTEPEAADEKSTFEEFCIKLRSDLDRNNNINYWQKRASGGAGHGEDVDILRDRLGAEEYLKYIETARVKFPKIAERYHEALDEAVKQYESLLG